jgi:hypothetical protein
VLPIITTRIDKLGEFEYRAYLKIQDDEGILEDSYITGSRIKAGKHLFNEIESYCEMMGLNPAEYADYDMIA